MTSFRGGPSRCELGLVAWELDLLHSAVGGTVPWISSGDVKALHLDATAQCVTAHAVKQNAAIVVPSGSIVLVTRSGILRKYLPVALLSRSMAINQDVKALRPLGECSAAFLLQSLIWNGDRILASCMKAGTTVESLEFGWLKAFTISLPDPPEQAAIAKVLGEMDAELVQLDARRDKIHALKQAMMQELLTGRIRLI